MNNNVGARIFLDFRTERTWSEKTRPLRRNRNRSSNRRSCRLDIFVGDLLKTNQQWRKKKNGWCDKSDDYIRRYSLNVLIENPCRCALLSSPFLWILVANLRFETPSTQSCHQNASDHKRFQATACSRRVLKLSLRQSKNIFSLNETGIDFLNKTAWSHQNLRKSRTLRIPMTHQSCPSGTLNMVMYRSSRMDDCPCSST